MNVYLLERENHKSLFSSNKKAVDSIKNSIKISEGFDIEDNLKEKGELSFLAFGLDFNNNKTSFPDRLKFKITKMEVY